MLTFFMLPSRDLFRLSLKQALLFYHRIPSPSTGASRGWKKEVFLWWDKRVSLTPDKCSLERTKLRGSFLPWWSSSRNWVPAKFHMHFSIICISFCEWINMPKILPIERENTELYRDSQSGISLFFNKNLLFRGRSVRKTVLCVNWIVTTKYAVRCRSLCECCIASAVFSVLAFATMLLVHRMTPGIFMER